MISESDATQGKPEAKSPCSCPFCDAPIEKIYPFCKGCGKDIRYCSECGKPLPADQDTCLECGS